MGLDMVVERLTPQILQGLKERVKVKQMRHVTIKNHRNLKERWKKLLADANVIPPKGLEGYDDLGEPAVTQIVYDIMLSQKERLVNMYLSNPHLEVPHSRMGVVDRYGGD